MFRFSAEDYLRDQSHVEHVDDSAEVGSPLKPPSIVRINKEIVTNIYLFVLTKFLEFHPVEQRFIHSIGDAAAKSGGVIILLDLPHSDGVNRCRKSAIHTAC